VTSLWCNVVISCVIDDVIAHVFSDDVTMTVIYGAAGGAVTRYVEQCEI